MELPESPDKEELKNKALDSLDVDVKRSNRYQKNYDSAFDMFMKRVLYAEFMRKHIEGERIKEIEQIDDAHIKKMLMDNYERNATKPPYMLMTINPRPEITLEELKKKVEKFANRSIVAEYKYVYEVRKPNEGLHCHMLFRYQNVRPHDLKKGAKNTFKHICDVNNSHVLNFKFITQEILQDKINYLDGQKKDAKKAGVSATIEYRKEHKLKDSYDSNPLLSCRVALVVD